MATRSLIGVYDSADEWHCRYAHWDGYPQHMGLSLCQIIERDGPDKALRVLLYGHYGWSSVTTEANAERIAEEDNRGMRHVPGYGFAYRERFADGWITRAHDTGAEYAYLIVPDTLMMDVYSWDWNDGRWRLFAAVDCPTRRMLTVRGELEMLA